MIAAPSQVPASPASVVCLPLAQSKHIHSTNTALPASWHPLHVAPVRVLRSPWPCRRGRPINGRGRASARPVRRDGAVRGVRGHGVPFVRWAWVLFGDFLHLPLITPMCAGMSTTWWFSPTRFCGHTHVRGASRVWTALHGVVSAGRPLHPLGVGQDYTPAALRGVLRGGVASWLMSIGSRRGRLCGAAGRSHAVRWAISRRHA